MPYIVPNTKAVSQIISTAQVVINGTFCVWPTDKIVESVKVIHHLEASIGCENTGSIPAELKFTLQQDIGDGWANVAGEVACYTIDVGYDARRKANFKVPYYDGISGFIPRYRILAACPTGEVTLHRTEGKDVVPTMTGMPEHEFAGEPPVTGPVFDIIDYKTPDYIYNAFADLHPHGRYFGSVSGGWFTASSRRPAGADQFAQIYLGRNYATEGQMAYNGSTILEQGTGGPLSLNIRSVMSIGSGKIARYLSGNVVGGEWGTPPGWGVFDLDPVANTATLIDDNRDFYGPYGDNEPLPGNQWDGNIYSSDGTVYYLSDPRSIETADSCSRFALSNTTGEATGLQTIAEVFGADRATWYNPSTTEWGMRAGKAIDGGGAIWANRTNVQATLADKKMDFLTITGGTKLVSNCSDTDGCPLAVATKGSVFVTCYLSALHSEDDFSQPQGLIRVRCGTLSGITPTFGASIDLYAGLNTFVPIPADMIHLGGEYYILVVGNMDGGTTDFFLLKTDGSTVTVENTMTMGATAWYQSIMLSPSGFSDSDYVLCHVNGETGSTTFPVDDRRYIFAVGDLDIIPIAEGVNTLSIQLDASVDRLLTVPTGLASMTIAFTSESTQGADMRIRAGERIVYPHEYDYELEDWATNSVTIPTPASGEWWLNIASYDTDDTVIAITFTP